MVAPEILERLRSRKPVTGKPYVCQPCSRKMAGGRYYVTVQETEEIILVCPDCWPSFLKELALQVGKEER